MSGRPKKPLLPALRPGVEPGGLEPLLRAYLMSGLTRGRSEYTITSQRIVLEGFIRWCYERGVTQVAEVSRQVLESYQRSLYVRRGHGTGRPLSVQTQYAKLSQVQSFFRWLARKNLLLYDPASGLELPRLGRKLPSDVLTGAEVDRLLAQPRLTAAVGLRDRAMLEVLYSTGMRRLELATLDLYDVRPSEGTLFIRQGKGRKDRLVPIGERALMWVERYVVEARGALVLDPAEKVLFVSADGERLAPGYLTHLVRRYLEQAGIEKRGACHLLRHSMATAMLKGGASIRHIQEILGHADLRSTQLYTHLSIEELKQAHAASHPAASLGRPRSQAPDQAADLTELLLDLDEGEDEGRGDEDD